MRKLFKCFSIMAIYLLITACPYESSVPLASPSEKLIPDLLGKWIINDGKGDHVVIKKLDKYKIRLMILNLIMIKGNIYQKTIKHIPQLLIMKFS